MSSRTNTLGPGLSYDYNLIILDGQSLMSGYQAVGLYSTAAKHNNKCIGQYARISGFGSFYGDTNFDPLVEGPAGGNSESPTSGCANMLADFINSNAASTLNVGGKVLVFVNIAAPGTTIEQHLPGGPADGTAELWPFVQTTMNDFKARVTALDPSATCGLAAVWWGQGEFNNGDTEAYYTAKLIELRADYDAEAVSVFGQTNPATWFISEIGGAFVADSAPGVQSAQVNYSLATPNTYCVGSYYHIPNIENAHRTGNGFRWFGTQGGRVMGQVLIERGGWEPLRPLQAQWDGNTLLVGFHVPNGALSTFATYYNATAVNYDDLGFNLYDAGGYIPCAVTIAADQVVQLVPQRVVDQSTAKLCYADIGGITGSPAHSGMGNLCDTNSLESEDIYAAPDQDSVAVGNNSAVNGAPAGTNYDIAGLTGLPYPQRNFCVGFQINPTTFTGTIGNVQGD